MENNAKKMIESEGRTTQEAIKKALAQLGATRDKVIVKILSEGEKGLYGMGGGKPAKVRVTMKNPSA